MTPAERVNIVRNLKVDWHYCPSCNKRTTVKEWRKCSACNCRVFWQGDDCSDAIEKDEDFYIWCKTIFGLTGWVHKSYWYDAFTLKQRTEDKFGKV